jgi:hypothetical protein
VQRAGSAHERASFYPRTIKSFTIGRLPRVGLPWEKTLPPFRQEDIPSLMRK